MKLLLDTHVLVWATTQSSLLSAAARTILQDPQNDLLVSVVSAYEVEYKRGRDPTLAHVPRNLIEALPANALRWLDLTAVHASDAAQLPRHHGDPFDRMIIAQALAEGATVVTSDRWFPAYGVPTIW
jgi:PIN domain nuclease of toxin-antitoxin system